jgi:branched-chain amino acid transport system permease protein
MINEILSAAVSIAFFGLAYAMVLYLISVGLSVTMGLMGFVNLAHGAFAMFGGYVMTTLMNGYGLPFWASLICAVIIVAAASVVIERLLYRHFYGGDELDQVLLTIGLVFMSLAVAHYFWGPLAQRFKPPSELTGQISLGLREFPTYRSFLIVSGAVLVTGLWLGLDRTRLGAMLRAAVDNPRMAQAVGIDTALLFTLTFALGSGLAALGGGLGAEILPIFPGYSTDYLIDFLIVVAIGGAGSIRGPFFAALLLGITQTAFNYLVPVVGSFFIYALTLALLMWRPRGLVGLP